MIKVICTSVERLPAQLAEGERAFTYFKGAKREGVGTIARSWHGSLKRHGFRPSPATWDFVQFCLRCVQPIYAQCAIPVPTAGLERSN